MPISFSSQISSFPLKKKAAVEKLLRSVIRKEKRKFGEISYAFCSDAFLLALNKNFLKHNTLTDIITFQYPGKELSAEIFISIPRVKENAKKFQTTFDRELFRVMIHGVLHLCGYKDKTAAQKKKMRSLEEHYLKKR